MRIASPRLAYSPIFQLPYLLLWIVASQLVLGMVPDDHSQPHDFVTLQSQALFGLSATEPKDGRRASAPGTLQAVVDAIEVMQDKYFDVFTGTWPAAIDWTAAVLGTHVSATLSSLATSINFSSTRCSEVLIWQNVIDRYFAHTSIFYFRENAFELRYQAYDDMFWVVLGWLENVKFMEMYSYILSDSDDLNGRSWHGLQFRPAAAHRARIFYELASQGWNTSLCDGGMLWNPNLAPYKNAITNELFISASISMYLYFPGDDNDSPFMTSRRAFPTFEKPHSQKYLDMAIEAYKWLQDSNMSNGAGLFADGFHIRGWHRLRNGTVVPGTGECDEINPMVYTYNQGVVLTGCRGLWIATGARSYLDDGHKLVGNVMKATGWPRSDGTRGWHGLGRDGVLEEFCDQTGRCDQNGQTFKGIFFHHLAEFCRPLRPQEEDMVAATVQGRANKETYRYHQARCEAYRSWIAYNAQAAVMTRDDKGRFGMWWGRQYPDTESHALDPVALPAGAVDYRNAGIPSQVNKTWLLVPEDATKGHGMSSGKSFSRAGGNENHDVNDRERGRTVETQSGGLAVLRALWQWESLREKLEPDSAFEL